MLCCTFGKCQVLCNSSSVCDHCRRSSRWLSASRAFRGLQTAISCYSLSYLAFLEMAQAPDSYSLFSCVALRTLTSRGETEQRLCSGDVLSANFKGSLHFTRLQCGVCCRQFLLAFGLLFSSTDRFPSDTDFLIYRFLSLY